MKRASRRALIEAASSVADGRPVDWAHLEESCAELSGTLRQLRLLASLADLTSDENELSPGSSWGSLEIRAKIGEGSFGEVYLARDPTLERDVALKLERPSSAGRNLHVDEARRLARVRHPNVLTIHGIESHDGRWGMWTDYIDGSTLEHDLTTHGVMDENTLVSIGRQLCAALGAVHAADIIHGDIKASNIMHDRDGRLILMDFGAGRERGDSQLAPAFGTPLSMAPELMRGQSPTIASDLYALGVLLYRLASGTYPAVAASRDALMQRLQEDGITPLAERRPELSDTFTTTVTRLLTPDAASRPAGAVEVQRALEAIQPGDELEPTADIPSLPRSTMRFVGRRVEIQRIRHALFENPLVSLVGPGGTGKTRLAVEIARRSSDLGPDGVYWIDLTALRDSAEIIVELATALDIRATGTEDLLAEVSAASAGRRLLLVFDNAEHLLADVANVIDTLTVSCPEVVVMTTSRTRLGLDNEYVFTVAPLSLPRDSKALGALDALESDAIRLFVLRAARAREDFRLTDANVGAVTQVCRHLDGVPLAIELAAARLRTLDENTLADRIETDLSILHDRSGQLSDRHATLDALIDWSLDLLSPASRTLFARASVFVGGFSLAAAERVCADARLDATHDHESPHTPPAGAMINDQPVVDLLSELVEQSLVEFRPPDAETPGRYRMLEVVRDRARTRLAARSDGAVTARSLVMWIRDIARTARQHFHGAEAVTWLDMLARERDNITATLDLATQEDVDLLAVHEIGYHLMPMWRHRGLERYGLRFCERVLELPEVAGGEDLRAGVLNSAGSLQSDLGRYTAAIDYFERAIAQHADDASSAPPRMNLGGVYEELGRHDEARACFHAARSALIRTGHHRGIVYSTMMLGVSCERVGELHEAKKWYDEALTLQREDPDNIFGLSMTLNNAAGARLRLGAPADALPLADEGIDLLRRSGYRSELSGSLVTLAEIHRRLNDLDSCREALLEAAEIHEDIESAFGLLHLSHTWGGYFREKGAIEPALTCLLFCREWQTRVGVRLADDDVAELEQDLARLEEELSLRTYANVRKRVRSMDRSAFLQYISRTA